ncbi:hypothetical protein ONZ45_g16327 [Pleurotus djamor]|nr:hypothetical protein ONZ45_g16327 [Pleurotus djamor]
MHQEHNIPWSVFPSNFKLIKDNNQVTPRKTALFSKGTSSQAAQLNHFHRVLTSTLTTFSETERKKYPVNFEAPLEGPLFSDALRDRYPEFLNERNQRIEYWISSRRLGYEEGSPACYTTSNGDLADVVKVLIYENQMETLLMLANHPSVPLADLQHLSWGHHFGFSRVAESAMLMYIFINALTASKCLDQAHEFSRFSSIAHLVTDSMDFCAQQIPHQKFLLDRSRGSFHLRENPFDDLLAVKAYLKELFKLLYTYDMLVRECRKSPRLEHEVIWAVRIFTDAKTDYSDPDGVGAFA